MPLLSDRYRLIMPDLRGHGWSDAPRRGYEKEQLADDLLGLLDALGLDRVRLVGHDWGGWTGFLACLRSPDRFRAFVALGIVHPFQRPSWSKAAQSWRGAYQLALSVPVLAEMTLRASPRPVVTAIHAGTVRTEAFGDEDLLTYASVLQQPARAHASVQMYRTSSCAKHRRCAVTWTSSSSYQRSSSSASVIPSPAVHSSMAGRTTDQA